MQTAAGGAYCIKNARPGRAREVLPVPSLFTHTLIAEDVLARLPENVRAAAKDLPAFLLGAQGGDVFFFCRAKDGGGKRRNLGRSLHREDVYARFCALAEAARRAGDFSYAAGYVCHYAADTIFHPYVYALCAQLSAENARVHWHTCIESDLDTLFLAAHGRPVQEQALSPRYGELNFAALYPQAAPLCAGLSERAFRAAVHRFYLYARGIRDPRFARRKFFAGAEKVLHAPRLLSTLYRRAEPEPAASFLRARKRCCTRRGCSPPSTAAPNPTRAFSTPRGKNGAPPRSPPFAPAKAPPPSTNGRCAKGRTWCAPFTCTRRARPCPKKPSTKTF